MEIELPENLKGAKAAAWLGARIMTLVVALVRIGNRRDERLVLANIILIAERVDERSQRVAGLRVTRRRGDQSARFGALKPVDPRRRRRQPGDGNLGAGGLQ